MTTILASNGKSIDILTIILIKEEIIREKLNTARSLFFMDILFQFRRLKII